MEMEMQTRRLGNSDMAITRIGLGTWAIGGAGYAFGWGPQDDQDSIRTIEEAVGEGINWIDTAPIYGLGHSERIVGRAVAAMASKPYLFTKLGLQWDERKRARQELIPAQVEQEIDASLERLGVDTVDLVQIHWPIPQERIEDTWAEMCRVRDKGKVRWIGVSNFDDAQLKRIARRELPTSNQPPFNLLQQHILDRTVPYCAEHSIGLIPYSPMLSGLLSDAFDRERIASLPDNDWRKRLPLLRGEALERFLSLLGRLKALAADRGTSVAKLAIAWTLRFDAITGVIVGARRPGQILETLGAAALELDDEFVRAIDQALDEYGNRKVGLY